ncbi:MAG: hypothetical protein AAF125_02055 [Chloroflexota bacterium]
MVEHANPQKKTTTENTSAKPMQADMSQPATATTSDMLDLQFDAGLPTQQTVAQIQRLQAKYGNAMLQRMITERGAVPTVAQHGFASRHRPPGRRTIYSDYHLQREEDAPAQNPKLSDDYMGEGFVDVGKRGIVHDNAGINVRDKPLPGKSSNVIQNLPQNTYVMILKQNPQSRWAAIRVMEGQYAGVSGYVVSRLIRDDLPDPNAVLYDVKGGDMLGQIVQNHPQYNGYNIRTGDDARSLVMAVYSANKGGKGVRLVGEADNSLVAKALDVADTSDYRDEMRQIYQRIQLVAGEPIWLPSKAYVQSLKDSGVIKQRSATMNAAIEVGKAYGGFEAGLLDGLLSSIVDLIVGIFDLAKGVIDAVVSVVTGEALSSASALYDQIKSLAEDPAALKKMASSLASALSAAFSSMVDNFVNKWTAPLIFDRWYFRGKVVGYIIAEIAMMFLSGGASAAKWLDKLGDLGKFFKNIVSRVDNALDALPDLPGKRRDRTPDDNSRKKRDDDDNTDPSERGRVITEAKLIAQTHDAGGSSLPVLMGSLNMLKRKNKWINEFYPEPKGGGHFRIMMRATEIDDDFTPGMTDQEVLDKLGDGPEAKGMSFHDPERMPNTSVIRARPGTATGGERLRDLDRTWLTGDPKAGNVTNRRMSLIPKQIADKMRGQNYADWNDFRRKFWKEVANDAELSANFGANNLREMQNGRPPFTIGSEATGGKGNAKYQLDHMIRIEDGGPVFDLDNLMVMTPKSHSGLTGQVGDQVRHLTKE